MEGEKKMYIKKRMKKMGGNRKRELEGQMRNKKQIRLRRKGKK